MGSHFGTTLSFSQLDGVFFTSYRSNTEDGTMRKSCKSDLVKQFENEVSPVLSLPDFDPSLTTYIRDSMALKSPKKFMSACLFSLTDRNFFQSGIFLPSMT
jgi:hypothetical protein